MYSGREGRRGRKNGRKKVLGEKENNEDNDEGERGVGGREDLHTGSRREDSTRAAKKKRKKRSNTERVVERARKEKEHRCEGACACHCYTDTCHKTWLYFLAHMHPPHLPHPSLLSPLPTLLSHFFLSRAAYYSSRHYAYRNLPFGSDQRYSERLITRRRGGIKFRGFNERYRCPLLGRVWFLYQADALFQDTECCLDNERFVWDWPRDCRDQSWFSCIYTCCVFAGF